MLMNNIAVMPVNLIKHFRHASCKIYQNIYKTLRNTRQSYANCVPSGVKKATGGFLIIDHLQLAYI
jgi:hypothetical protein